MFCSSEKIAAGKNPNLMLHEFGPTQRRGRFKWRRTCSRCGMVETQDGQSY